LNFADVLREHNIPYQTEGKYCRPGWIQFNCPFCFGGLDPNKPYAGYNIARQYVNCWRCGGHGVGKVLIALTGMNWKNVKALLEDLDVPQREDDKPPGKLTLPKNRKPLAKAHRRYLEGRGFDPDELAEQWGIEGIGLSGNLAWRIFIPIHYRGAVVSWTTRSLVDYGARYISAAADEEAVPHKTLLYGEDRVPGNAISIHEGPTDVWAIGPGATATLGTGYTPAQILRMSRYARRIVCFDSEKAAQQRARALCSLLEVFPGETFNVKLDAKDAGSAKRSERKQLRKLLT